MRKPATIPPGSGSLRIVLPLVLWAALGCAPQPRTAPFQLKESIAFGPIAVRVNGWEEVGESHAPLSSLRAPEGEKVIAVFVEWSGLEPYSEQDRQVFAEKFLRGSLTLVDAGGTDFEAVSAMTREIYRFSSLNMPAPRDWVVVFHVSADSRGYTLRLTHPDQGEEAFDVAVVSLG